MLHLYIVPKRRDIIVFFSHKMTVKQKSTHINTLADGAVHQNSLRFNIAPITAESEVPQEHDVSTFQEEVTSFLERMVKPLYDVAVPAYTGHFVIITALADSHITATLFGYVLLRYVPVISESIQEFKYLAKS